MKKVCSGSGYILDFVQRRIMRHNPIPPVSLEKHRVPFGRARHASRTLHPPFLALWHKLQQEDKRNVTPRTAPITKADEAGHWERQSKRLRLLYLLVQSNRLSTTTVIRCFRRVITLKHLCVCINLISPRREDGLSVCYLVTALHQLVL